MPVTVARLFSYPLKSARGFAVGRLTIGPGGPDRDRQWVVCDEHGTFVAQRSSRGRGIGIRELCLVETGIEDGALRLRAPGIGSVAVPADEVRARQAGPELPVRIWDDVATAVDQGDEVAAWLTEHLGRYRPGRYRLARMPDRRTRLAPDGRSRVGFADSYPLLVGSEASLADLNGRIAAGRSSRGEAPEPDLGWDRFRPNVVLDGIAAYAEDSITGIAIGELRLRGESLCVRCPIPATDQRTAERGKEPLRTLAGYRRRPDSEAGGGVVFARNFSHDGSGEIAVGDRVELLDPIETE